MQIKILLADDHTIILDGLSSIIEKHEDMVVVGHALDGREAVKMASKLKPDVVLMDVTMPNLNGMEATSQITSSMPDVKIIALSMHSDKVFVEKMFLAGASGYITKDCDLKELAHAIRIVAEGKTYVSPTVAEMLIDSYRDLSKSPKDYSSFSILSAREREVLQLIAEGKSTKEIAHLLNVSIKTIESHRRRMMDKLEIDNIADLIKYAIREGITTI